MDGISPTAVARIARQTSRDFAMLTLCVSVQFQDITKQLNVSNIAINVKNKLFMYYIVISTLESKQNYISYVYNLTIYMKLFLYIPETVKQFQNLPKYCKGTTGQQLSDKYTNQSSQPFPCLSIITYHLAQTQSLHHSFSLSEYF